MKKRRVGKRAVAAALLAAVTVSTAGAVLSPVTSVTAEAAWSADLTGDDTRWVGQSSLSTVLKASLLRSTDSGAVYEQLMLGILYKTFSESDILELIQEGYTIPEESLYQLYAEGWISGYTYKTGTGQSYTAEDFDDVFDADYYVAANPLIAEAVAAGTLAYDEQTLLYHWLVCGIPAGLDASADFSFSYFESRYPNICASVGYDKLSEVVYYITHRDTYVLQGNG